MNQLPRDKDAQANGGKEAGLELTRGTSSVARETTQQEQLQVPGLQQHR